MEPPSPDELDSLREAEGRCRKTLLEAEAAVRGAKSRAQWLSELQPASDFPFATSAHVDAEIAWVKSFSTTEQLSEWWRRRSNDGAAPSPKLSIFSEFLAVDDSLRIASKSKLAQPVELYNLRNRRERLAAKAVCDYQLYLRQRGIFDDILQRHIEAAVQSTTRGERSEWTAAKEAVDDAEARQEAKARSRLHATGRGPDSPSSASPRGDTASSVKSGAKSKDRVLNDIRDGLLTGVNVSARFVREKYGSNEGYHEQIQRGRAALKTPSELDQYLLSYGLMCIEGWTELLRLEGNYVAELQSIRLVDYGCGQGLSTLMMLDHIRSTTTPRAKVGSAVLIEPSHVALERARGLVGLYVPHVVPLNCPIAELRHEDQFVNRSEIYGASSHSADIHVFSEVLDIARVDATNLADFAFSSRRRHLVYVLSHDRSFDGGVPNLERFDRALRSRFPSADVLQGGFTTGEGRTEKVWRYFFYSFQG